MVFEVGPGPGFASRELLRLGADPLFAIEPDPRLTRYLRATLRPRSRVRVVRATFEDAALPEGSFDLGVAATSFHWIHGRRGVPKVARLLKPGGWWAMWWNRYGDPDRRGRFFEAIQPLYTSRATARARWVRRARRGERLETSRRLALLGASGSFDRISYELLRWSVTLTAPAVRGLWATFGEVTKMTPKARRRFLDGIERIAREEFGGRVRIDMRTPMYTARRG